jgi:hypothetical protein
MYTYRLDALRFLCIKNLLLAAAFRTDRNTVLKKLMLWQRTALGPFPAAVQTSQALWSCTNVHMNGKVVTLSHGVTGPVLQCRFAPPASQDAQAFLKLERPP